MRVCKYCNKPIADDEIWNKDETGNGYHHSCLIEMEFNDQNRKIYNKGKVDALAEIEKQVEEMIIDHDIDMGEEIMYNSAITDVLEAIRESRKAVGCTN